MSYVLLGGLALILLLASRSASAAPAASAAPSSQGGAVVGSSARKIYDRLRGPLEKYGGPMPPAAMALVIYRESGGRTGAIVRGAVTGASEIGLCQLVVEHDDAGNPNTSATYGAVGANVDPLDPIGAIYGAQWVYSRAAKILGDYMATKELDPPADTDVAGWIAVMHGDHSIGLGGMKRLVDVCAGSGSGSFVDRLRDWHASSRPFPSLGLQSPSLVKMRVGKMLRLAREASAVAPLPGRITPLPPRDADVPRFNAARAKAAIAAAPRR